MIHKIGPFLDFDSNIYLLTGDRNIMIDTGTGHASSSVIRAAEDILSGANLDLILLTHCHFDHIGGASQLIDTFGS